MLTGLDMFAPLAQSSTATMSVGLDLLALARRFFALATVGVGFDRAGFVLSGEDLTSIELKELYSSWIACRALAKSSGLVATEGYVVDLRLLTNGVEFQHTIRPDLFMNEIDVWYSDAVGSRQKTGTSANTDSQALFGDAARIISIGGATSVGATARRDSDLIKYAWPRSRAIGGDAREYMSDNEPLPDLLTVMLAGYFYSMNNRYQQTTINETDAADALSTLVGNSEFVTAGRIEANDFGSDITVDCLPIPKRIGDAVQEVASLGDTSGNVWECGVYEDRKLIYEQADTSHTYVLEGERLTYIDGSPAILALVRPGFLVRIVNAPSGWIRPGTSSDWDNPKIRYVHSVEYKRADDQSGDTLKMYYQDPREGAGAAIARQVTAGVI